MVGKSNPWLSSGDSHRGSYCVHSCVDDRSRLAYCEMLSDERGPTRAGFLRRAAARFDGHGIAFERVMTDNARNYRAAEAFRTAMAELGARPMFAQPYRPQLNAEVERLNRTPLEEWAYARPYTSNAERSGQLALARVRPPSSLALTEEAATAPSG